MVVSKMPDQGCAGPAMTRQSPRAATSDPEIGVHKPASRSTPEATISTSTAADPMGGPVSRRVAPHAIAANPAPRRRSRRPTPGAPRANVENRRCKSFPQLQALRAAEANKAQKEHIRGSFELEG